MSDEPLLARRVPMSHLYPYHVLIVGTLVLMGLLTFVYATATPASPTPFQHAVSTAVVTVATTVLFDYVASRKLVQSAVQDFKVE